MTNKYGHNIFEIVMMVIITAFSNGFIINNLWLAQKQKLPHIIFLVSMILITSFMYHLCESIGEPIFLDEYQWHQLDNVASICGFIEIFIYFMQLDKYWKLTNSWIYFMVVVILQEGYPWELWATIVPIIVSFLEFILIGIFFIRKTKKRQVNKEYLKKGLFFLFVAIFSFYKGLDEYTDYLRFWHGMWHLSVSASFFHLYQIYEIETHSYLKFWKNDQQIIKL